jgi:hypothetical protein
MTQRTRSEILGEVDEMADELMTLVPEVTFEEAQAAVFEEYPDIYDEYASAPPEMPSQPVAKSEPEITLSQAILEAVQTEAGRRAWTQWPNKSLGELEYEVWSSPEGSQLYDLHRNMGSIPYSEASITIGKSFEHQDAWQTLSRWLP